MKNHAETIERVNTNVALCHETLVKLKDTCCMSTRSAKMVLLAEKVQNLGMKTEDVTDAYIDTHFVHVEDVGAALGTLYATCCTKTREKLYQDMFRALGIINLGLHKLNGVSH